MVFEKNSRIGGLLRIGIPDFKMEKHLIDRRMSQMKLEGVEFKANAHIGVDISFDDLNQEFDAIAFCGGSEKPRDYQLKEENLMAFTLQWNFFLSRMIGSLARI